MEKKEVIFGLKSMLIKERELARELPRTGYAHRTNCQVLSEAIEMIEGGAHESSKEA